MISLNSPKEWVIINSLKGSASHKAVLVLVNFHCIGNNLLIHGINQIFGLVHHLYFIVVELNEDK